MSKTTKSETILFTKTNQIMITAVVGTVMSATLYAIAGYVNDE